MKSTLPPATREQERELIARAQSGDIAARNELIERNLALIYTATMKAKRWGFDVEDAYSVGVEAFIYSIERFNPQFGRLSTYAVRCIKHKVTGWCYEHAGAVRTPRPMASRRLLEKRKPETQAALVRAKKPSISIYGDSANKKGDENRNIADSIADRESTDHDALEGLPNVEQLRAAIAQLPERQRLIIERRMTMTLKEVGEEIGITRERVRQIELVAKATIKSLLTQGAR